MRVGVFREEGVDEGANKSRLGKAVEDAAVNGRTRVAVDGRGAAFGAEVDVNGVDGGWGGGSGGGVCGAEGGDERFAGVGPGGGGRRDAAGVVGEFAPGTGEDGEGGGGGEGGDGDGVDEG